MHKVPAELAVQSAIVARLADMLAAVIVSGALVAIAWSYLVRMQSLLLPAMLLAAIVLLLAAIAMAVAWFSAAEKTPRVADTATSSPSIWRKMLSFSMQVARPGPAYMASTLPTTLMYSLVLQVVIAVAITCHARAFNLEIGFFEAALVGVVSSFIASIPITVLGGLGVYEVSTVGLFVLLGVPAEAAAGMILVVRTVFFLVMALALALVRPASP